MQAPAERPAGGFIVGKMTSFRYNKNKKKIREDDEDRKAYQSLRIGTGIVV